MNRVYKILLIIMCIFFLSFMVNAEECNINSIEINSISVKEKSEYVEELSEASFKGDKIYLNLKMFDVGDYIEYTLKVKNESNDDFYFDENSLNINSNYFDYSLTYKDNSNKIESGTLKTIYLKVQYKKEVDKEKFFSGKYVDKNNVLLDISTKNPIITNPLTKNNKLFLSLVLFVIGFTIIYFKNNKIKLNIFIIFILSVFIPINVYSLCECKLNIDSNITIGKVKPNPCTYDGNLIQGAEYVNGQYTYTYKPIKNSSCTLNWNGNSWVMECNKEYHDFGWGVELTDKESTDAVTTKLCTSINDEPIISMRYMFQNSKASSIDLSSFDTSNVVDMYEMFMFNHNGANNFRKLDFSTFDTSKVINMAYMFQYIILDDIDLSFLDTSNVETIEGMFQHSIINKINMENLNLSKLKTMNSSFEYSISDFVNLNNIKIDNLENMNFVFCDSNIKKIVINSVSEINLNELNYTFKGLNSEDVLIGGIAAENLKLSFPYSKINKLNLKKIDFRKVKNADQMFLLAEIGESYFPDKFSFAENANLSYMFERAKINILDLQGMNTSNVLSMKYFFSGSTMEELILPKSFSFNDGADINSMFYMANIPTIDISGMDTSNVSNMSSLFYDSKVEEIKLPKKFSFDSIMDKSGMYNLFSGIPAKMIDLTSIDIEDKMIGSAILYKTNFDIIYVKSEEDAEWFRENGDYVPNNFNYVIK